MIIIKKAINRILRQREIKSLPSDDKHVYLTFDDGPEPGITDFVLDELDKYGFKATFFCRGDNAERYSDLLTTIQERGHVIGNHTYSHLHAYNNPANTYLNDVFDADAILHTSLFRPPHGSLTIQTWWRLRNRKIVFWSLNSGDSDHQGFNYERSMHRLITQTSGGDIILFHFCRKHEKETRILLPDYLKWLSENGYVSDSIPN